MICFKWKKGVLYKDLQQITNRATCYIKAYWTTFQQATHSIKKPLFYLIVIYFLAFSSILRANFNYIDDMGRTFSGYRGWYQGSRYLSDFLSLVLHGSSHLSDISPLPQLVAILFLALSSIIVIQVISEHKKISIWQVLAVLPLGLSPYFLECISYKFDSPYMALSILFSVIPLLLNRRNSWLYGIVAFLGTVAMCMTYQASSGIFPMLVVLLSFKRWNQGESWKTLAQFVAISAIGYCVGIFFFQLFLMHPFPGYVDNSLPPLNRILPTFWTHLKTYYSLVQSDFRHIWLVLFQLCTISFLYTTARNSKRSLPSALLASLVTLFSMFLLAFGLYPFLSTPIYSCRGMYGFGVLIALICVTNVSVQQVLPVKLIIWGLSWLFFVFSLSYGNALYSQKEYTDFRITNVIQAMSDLEIFTTEEVKTIHITGSIGLSPVLRNQPQSYQILNRLIPITFRGPGWYWGIAGFSGYYGLKNVNVVFTPPDDFPPVDELLVLKNNMYFTIQGKGQYILISLK